MNEVLNILIHSIKKRGILRTLWGLFLCFAYIPLKLLNYPAEAYSRWFNRWDLDTFGL